MTRKPTFTWSLLVVSFQVPIHLQWLLVAHLFSRQLFPHTYVRSAQPSLHVFNGEKRPPLPDTSCGGFSLVKKDGALKCIMPDIVGEQGGPYAKLDSPGEIAKFDQRFSGEDDEIVSRTGYRH